MRSQPTHFDIFLAANELCTGTITDVESGLASHVESNAAEQLQRQEEERVKAAMAIIAAECDKRETPYSQMTIPLFAPVWSPHPRRGNKSRNESDAWPKMAEGRHKQDNCHRMDASTRRYQKQHLSRRPRETGNAQTGTQRLHHLNTLPTPHPRHCSPRLGRWLAEHHGQRAQLLGGPPRHAIGMPTFTRYETTDTHNYKCIGPQCDKSRCYLLTSVHVLPDPPIPNCERAHTIITCNSTGQV